MNFIYKTSVLLFISGSMFLSCKSKQENKKGIVGKWVYKEMSYTSANRSYNNMDKEQREKRKEEDDREAKGTTFLFNADKTFVITPGIQKEPPATGTYEFKENGELLMKRKATTREEIATVTFPAKNTMKLEAPRNGIIIIMTRVE